jgi:hypothetical protein
MRNRLLKFFRLTLMKNEMKRNDFFYYYIRRDHYFNPFT